MRADISGFQPSNRLFGLFPRAMPWAGIERAFGPWNLRWADIVRSIAHSPAFQDIGDLALDLLLAEAHRLEERGIVRERCAKVWVFMACVAGEVH